MLILVPSLLEFRALFPELPPEEAERAPLAWTGGHEVALIGVGLAAAGGRAGVAMMSCEQGGIVLAGLAGSLAPDELGVGDVVVGEQVELDGVGFGSGESFAALQDARGPLAEERDSAAPLALSTLGLSGARRGGILSVCAASANEAESRQRRARFPACIAEDMESWAVARAARSARRELLVVRVVSNIAGDRDHSRWSIAESLSQLGTLLGELPETLSREART